jgi:hypothetical protein
MKNQPDFNVIPDYVTQPVRPNQGAPDTLIADMSKDAFSRTQMYASESMADRIQDDLDSTGPDMFAGQEVTPDSIAHDPYYIP